MFERVLFGTDTSEASVEAIKAAIAMGMIGLQENIIASVLDLSPGSLFSHGNADAEGARSEQVAKLNEQLFRLKDCFGSSLPKLDTQVWTGKPAELLCEKARLFQSQLIVLGRNGLGALHRFVLGSVSSQVIQSSPCPVLILPEGSKEARPIKNIVVPLDFSESSVLALRAAGDLARETGACVHLYHAVPFADYQPMSFAGIGVITQLQNEMQKQTEKALNELAQSLRDQEITTQTHCSGLMPIPGILDCAATNQAELILMTSHGRSGFQKFWRGNVADAILNRSDRPVLVIPCQEQSA